MTESIMTRQSDENMAALTSLKRGMLFIPNFQHVRHRSKVNIQRPKPRHDARRLFEAITKPIIMPEPIPHTEVCARKRAHALQSVLEVNPYEEFLLRQCKKMLAENRMVAVCQALPMTAEQKKAAKNKLMKMNMYLCFFNNSLMRQSVEDSPLANLSPYLIGRNLYVVSQEPQVDHLVKMLRKIPDLVLLGGRVDNYILSREAMLKAAKLPSLDVLRGELVTILGSSTSRLYSLLTRQQQVLAANLDQYVRQLLEVESPSDFTASAPASSDSS